MKICSKCLIEKNKSEFSKARNREDGLQTVCRICAKESIFKWRDKNPEKTYLINKKARHKNDKYRDWTLKKKYGLSFIEYNELLERQNFSCAICNKNQSDCKTLLHVDHCHESGKIRGLLCMNCNTGIGSLKESTDLLQKAIEYIKKHKDLICE